MKMESESSILPDKSDNSTLKECWNGGKRASQLNIDLDATELLLSNLHCFTYLLFTVISFTFIILDLLKEKWSLIIDKKTNKKQILNDIAQSGMIVLSMNLHWSQSAGISCLVGHLMKSSCFLNMKLQNSPKAFQIENSVLLNLSASNLIAP